MNLVLNHYCIYNFALHIVHNNLYFQNFTNPKWHENLVHDKHTINVEYVKFVCKYEFFGLVLLFYNQIWTISTYKKCWFNHKGYNYIDLIFIQSNWTVQSEWLLLLVFKEIMSGFGWTWTPVTCNVGMCWSFLQ